MPLYRLIEAHVLAAERLHGDDTTVPVMAKGKDDTARLWVNVRDEVSCRPMLMSAIMSFTEGRGPGPVFEAACSAHARRKFFELADVEGAAPTRSRGQRSSMIYPIALGAVQRLDALFDIERAINGKDPTERWAVSQQLTVPLMAESQAWLTAQVEKLWRGHDLAKACICMLRRWDAFSLFLEDGRVCLTNNTA